MALVFAITGGAFAAGVLPKNSVNSKSIKDNTVSTKDVRDKSLLARDFKGGQLPAGAKGDKGDPGSARGYALVQYSGTVIASSSTSNVTVSKIGTGEYCVGLTDGTVANAVATIERQDGQTVINGSGLGFLTHVEIVRPGAAMNGCSAGQVEVDTMLLDGTTMGEYVNVAAMDEPFFIVIP